MSGTLVWSDNRAGLITEADQRYRLTGPDGTALITFGEADSSNVAWLAEEPEGWAAPSVDLPMDDKQDGHGSYSGEQSYEARVLTITGSAVAPDLAAAASARRRLVNALTSTVRAGGELLWTHLDDDPAKSLWVHLNGKPLVAQDGRWLDYSFVLIADYPIKHGDPVTYGPVRLRSTEHEPGRSYTAGVRSYTAGVRSYVSDELTTDTVARIPPTGEGGETAHALYTITGPVPSPVVKLSTGEYVALRLDLDALDVAVIDTDLGTVAVNGVNRYDAFGAGSTFPMIPPEGTEVRLLSGTGGTSQAASLTVTTAPAWT